MLTSTKDLARNLCSAVSHANQQDTDMVIVSKDKQLLPFHTSLLSLFSPVAARLLSEIPCCAAPTIFLPDFHARHIRKLLQILRFGQAISGETVNTDIKKIIAIAKVLQISVTDLIVGPYLDNPLGVPFEMKPKSNILKVKQERHAVVNVNENENTDSFNVKQEAESVKQELMEQHEYIEEDVTEKTLKQEYNFQTIVQEEGQESSALEKEDYNSVGIHNIQRNDEKDTESLKCKTNSKRKASLKLLRQKELIIGSPRHLNKKPRNIKDNFKKYTNLQSCIPSNLICAHKTNPSESSKTTIIPESVVTYSTENSTTIIPFSQY